MSPLGKFILERVNMESGLSDRDVNIIAFHMLPNQTFYTRYMVVVEYANKLGIEINSSY